MFSKNEKEYFQIMNTSYKESSKHFIPKFVKGDRILDVGSGGGVMLEELETLYGGKKTLYGTDIRPDVITMLRKKAIDTNAHWDVQLHNFVKDKLDYKVDTIIFSSILHEIFSFTDISGKLFNIESIVIALNNAYASLNPGGRIIIRDGVKLMNSGESDTLTLRNKKDLEFWKRFINDFKGLPTVSRGYAFSEQGDACTITAAKGLLHEFMFKLNWGEDSYGREIHEQFGYLSENGYRDILEGLSFDVQLIKAEFEPGYKKYFDELFIDYPKYPTNIFIVANKA